MDRQDSISRPIPGLWHEGYGPETATEWINWKRMILRSFSQNVYGSSPTNGFGTSIRLLDSVGDAVSGLATRHRYEVRVDGPSGDVSIMLNVYVPMETSADGLPPVLLGLNFGGNHTIEDDDSIPIETGWAATQARGSDSGSWAVAAILRRGYAAATAHYMDIEPDFPGKARFGVRGIFPSGDRSRGAAEPTWGAVAAWAWGISRLVDALMVTGLVDAGRIAVHGHSRLGKAALWAAAQDERITGVVSFQSGCAGASLFRHLAGESIRMITDSFPYWFAETFSEARSAPELLPVDQHQLIATVAPRPVLIASASDDHHADPVGEFMSSQLAAESYARRGCHRTEDLMNAAHDERGLPQRGTLIGGELSYYVRDGKHEVREDDWSLTLDFLDEHL